jgi:GNAT superfamily N-acetyltransferase
MDLQIRLATLDDIPALHVLIHESVRGLSGSYYSPAQIESALVHVFGVDSQLIHDGTYFVVTCANEIIGSGGWSKRRTLFGGDQSKPSAEDEPLDPTSEAARIRAFYVHPRWSRKGVSTMILNSCENAAREAGFKRIELVATLPGEPFYSARNYQRAEAVPIETPDGESLPAYRMFRLL